MNSSWLFKRLDETGSNASQFANASGWQKSRVYELKSGKTKKNTQRIFKQSCAIFKY